MRGLMMIRMCGPVMELGSLISSLVVRKQGAGTELLYYCFLIPLAALKLFLWLSCACAVLVLCLYLELYFLLRSLLVV